MKILSNLLSSFLLLFLIINTVRSLASVAYRKAMDHDTKFHFNFFAVNINEELGALYGPVLERQTEFVTFSIQHILKLYEDSPRKPKSVVLIGHSMVRFGHYVRVNTSCLFAQERFPLNKYSILGKNVHQSSLLNMFDTNVTDIVTIFYYFSTMLHSNFPVVLYIHAILAFDTIPAVPSREGWWQEQHTSQRTSPHPPLHSSLHRQLHTRGLSLSLILRLRISMTRWELCVYIKWGSLHVGFSLSVLIRGERANKLK